MNRCKECVEKAPTVNFVDALAPWLFLALIIFLLLRVQGAIQRRIFGVGYMLAADHSMAAVVYTLVLFPGIVLHEVTEWVTAGILNFRTVRSMRWPEADQNGELDPKFVTVEYPKREKGLGPPGPAARAKDLFSRALVEIAPTLAGLACTLLISNNLLGFPDLIRELPSGDLTRIGPALGAVVRRPDFFLWFYVLFTISNSMMPRRFARRGLAVLAVCAALGMVFLAVIGFSRVVEEWMLGPIPTAVNQLSAISMLVLVVDGIVLLIVIGLEYGAERLTQRQAPYKVARAKAQAVRQARSAGPQLTSIYQYMIPIPTVTDVASIRSRTPKPEPVRAPTGPAPSAFPSDRPAAPAADRPAFSPSPKSQPSLPAPAAKPEGAESPGFGGTRLAPPAPPERQAPAPQPASGAFGASRPPEPRPAAPAQGSPAPRPPVPGGGPPPSPFSKPAPTGGSATLAPRPNPSPGSGGASGGSPGGSGAPVFPRTGPPAPPGAVPQRGAPTGAPKPNLFGAPPPGGKPTSDKDKSLIEPEDEEPGFSKGVRYEDLEDTP